MADVTEDRDQAGAELVGAGNSVTAADLVCWAGLGVVRLSIWLRGWGSKTGIGS